MVRYRYLALIIALFSIAAAPTRVSTYTTGTTIRSADVTANENAIFNYLQAGVDTFSAGSIMNAAISSSAAIAYSKLNLTGGVVNADISASAAIVYSKLSLTGGIVNADINASAAIADSKLAQITTASKVHGSSITGLASVPAGAGVLPVANLASGVADGTKFVRDDGTLAVPAGVSGIDQIASTSFSGQTSVSVTGLTAGKIYRVILKFSPDTGSTANYGFRIASDTTGDYALVGETQQGTTTTAFTTTATAFNMFNSLSLDADSYGTVDMILVTSTDSTSITTVTGTGIFSTGTDVLTRVNFAGDKLTVSPTSVQFVSIDSVAMSGEILVMQLN